MGVADDVRLVDHHCHGLMPGELSATDFALLATEADTIEGPGMASLEHPFGLGVRAFCAPELGLPAHASIDDYVHRRAEIGAAEVNRRLLAATRSEMLLNDTGFTASPVMDATELQRSTGIQSREVLRLESVAEEVAAHTSASGFASAFQEALAERAPGVVGFKSIIAYRYGFDLQDHPPEAAEVERAASTWIAEIERTGSPRLTDPTLLQFLIWSALPFAKPIQFHTGFGDSDLVLHLADPSRATKFFQATQKLGAKFILLHNYPFLREAGILAQVFPHVYCDAGLTGHYLGPSGITAHRQLLEIAPFTKILYSSDAYGLAEHYFLSARTWRRSYALILDEWIAEGWTNAEGAERIVAQVARENAVRLYGLAVDEEMGAK